MPNPHRLFVVKLKRMCTMPKASSSVSTLKGVAIGDLHFDKLLNLIPNINIIINKFLRSLLTQAVANKQDVAILLGDIFNYMNASEQATRLFLKTLVEFQDLIDIYVIEGNHGYKRSGTGSLSMLSMLEEFALVNVTFVTQPIARIVKGVPLVFLPYPYTSVQDVAKKDYPAFRGMLVDIGLSEESIEQADSLGADLESCFNNAIGFGHFTRSGSIQDNGTSAKGGSEHIKELDCKHYIVGHLHTPQVLGTKANSTNYPGTFYQTSFGESEDKGYGEFVASYQDDTLKFKYRHVSVDPPILLKTIYVDSLKTLPKLSDISKTTYYKVRVSKGIKIPKEYLGSKNFIFENLNSKTDKVETASTSIFEDTESTFDLKVAVREFLDQYDLTEKEKSLGMKMFERATDDLGVATND